MKTETNDFQSARQQPLPGPPRFGRDAKDALFLDFDGTLVDIAPHPDAIEVAASLLGLLEVLTGALEGKLAIVSGRSLADLERHLGRLDIAMAGSHGGEFRPAGTSEVQSLADPLPGNIVAALEAISERHGGLLVEPKPFSAAIHFRDRPQAEADVLARTQDLADRSGLKLTKGKMVAELAMPGSDKGSAVARFMDTPVFSGSQPVFVGDDITDEDAFKTVLDFEGGGVLVGPERKTAARWRLPGVAHVHDWLKAILQ